MNIKIFVLNLTIGVQNHNFGKIQDGGGRHFGLRLLCQIW